MQDYQKLAVWRKAHAVAMDIHRACKIFPRRDGLVLRGQLQRAALSIPANIAEGAGKLGRVEFARYLEIALGSASETQYHLLVARDTELLEASNYDDLSTRVTEVRRMLFGLIKRVRSAPPEQQQTSSTAGTST
jgi:four helix bundle protein